MRNIIRKTTGAVIMAVCLGAQADTLTVPLGSQGSRLGDAKTRRFNVIGG